MKINTTKTSEITLNKEETEGLRKVIEDLKPFMNRYLFISALNQFTYDLKRHLQKKDNSLVTFFRKLVTDKSM